MTLCFDTSKSYAVALEGGGARGAYQVGAWKALREEGIKIEAVAGTSVGALNGVMMASDDFDLAESLWQNMTFSRVMKVDDAVMRNLMRGNLLDLDLKNLSAKTKTILKEGGFDVSPLKGLIKECVNHEKIVVGPDFYICTHSLTDKKGLEFKAQDLDEKTLCDMLLASAYFPAFKHEPIGGKRYTDGGVSNVLPLSPLIKAGHKNILAIRLYGFGVKKKVTLPADTKIYEIAPNRDLGNMLNFDTASCKANFTLGYFDAKRFLYGLYGEKYYIDRTLSEAEAFDILCAVTRNKSGPEANLRQLHERVSALSRHSKSKGDYYDVLVAFLEKSAEKLGINEFCVFTDTELINLIGRTTN